MAVVQNKATAIGDIIYIKTSVPLLGLVTLQSFVDTTVGETGIRYFNREFRYSTNGITYSPWIPLTIPNIQAISVSPNNTFYIEYHYERVGSDPTGNLEFLNNSLVATYQALSCGPIYNKSPFASYFACYDVKVLEWCLSVCEKLYKPGLIPTYLTRNKNNNQNNEDEDYIAFWCTVCCYFALFVTFARLFEDFENNKEILAEYLIQKGLFICVEDSQLADLLFLMSNYYNEISKRGTKGVDNRKINGDPVDGELLRLFCHDFEKCGDVIMSLTETWKFGWTINRCSPIYRGTFGADMAVRGYENNPLVVDLAKYPILNPTQVTIVNDLIDGVSKDTIQMDFSTNLGPTGINFPSSPSGLIKIDPKITYEITFDYKVINSTDLQLNFGCLCFNSAGAVIGFVSLLSGPPANHFFVGPFFGVLQVWNSFRGIIHGSCVNTNILIEKRPINGQTHFKFPSNACKISPIVYITSTGPSNSAVVRVANLRVRPAITPYSTGFLQTNNWINIWGENKNSKYSKGEVKEIIRRFLIPYNSFFEVIYTDELCLPQPTPCIKWRVKNISSEVIYFEYVECSPSGVSSIFGPIINEIFVILNPGVTIEYCSKDIPPEYIGALEVTALSLC